MSSLPERLDVRLSLFQMEEQLARGQQVAIDHIQKSAAEMLIEHALQQEDGLSRQSWLREALDVTRGRGWAAPVEERIQRELQRIDLDSYGWQEASAEVHLPAEEVEAWIAAIVGDGRA